MALGLFDLRWTDHKWAIIYCSVSTFGALCYGYDQIYYTGVLGMTPFINAYGKTTDEEGNTALTTTFLSLTASIIYVGELVGALLAAPINDRFGRKGVFYCASAWIVAGAVVQAADKSTEGLIIFGPDIDRLGHWSVSYSSKSRLPFSTLTCFKIHRDVSAVYRRSGSEGCARTSVDDVPIDAVMQSACRLRHNQGYRGH